MSRPRNTRNPDRWYLPRTHQYSNLGYCYNCNGKVYTYVTGHVRQATYLNWLVKLKDAALDILQLRIHEQLNGTAKTKVMTVFELIEKYQDLHFPNMSKTNISKHLQSFNNFLDKDLPLNSDLLREYLNKKITNSVLSPNTIHRLLVIINRLFNFAVNDNYIDKNPLLKAMFPKTFKPEFKLLDDLIVNKAIDYFRDRNKKMYYLIRFIRLTGARIQEAVNLRTTDIIQNKHINIQGKGNEPRQFTIKPFPDLIKLCREITEISRNEGFTDKRLFGYINCKTPQQHLRNAFRKLNVYVDGRLFHSIRKLRENELLFVYHIPDKIVAQMLGHTVQTQRMFYEKYLQAEEQAKLISEITM